MAVKSKSKKKSPVSASEQNKHPVYRQIWGILYLALAILLLTSMVSHQLSMAESLLGPWFGSYLALGFEYFFGAIPQLFIPCVLVYIGINILMDLALDFRRLFLTALLICILCVFMAIPNLPKVADPEFYASGNLLGYLVVRFVLSPLFGTARFGSYFIFAVLFLLTSMLFFRIDIVDLFHRVGTFFSQKCTERWPLFITKVCSLFGKKRVSHENKNDAIIIEETSSCASSVSETPVLETPQSAQIPVQTPISPDSVENPHVEEKEPQTSSAETFTYTPAARSLPAETPEVSQDTQNEEDDGGSIADAALLDPLLASGEGTIHKSTVSSTMEVEVVEPEEQEKEYRLPSPDLIPDPPVQDGITDEKWITDRGRDLIRTLEEFKVKGCVITRVNPGPVVTQFEIELAPGIRVGKVLGLQTDLALKVGGKAIRIQAPIPGRTAIGIEIPNDKREMVYYKKILLSPEFSQCNAKLPVIIGESIAGVPKIEDIAKMPHILIAGQTGAGKSVGINSFIATLLFSKTPKELRLIMIDPKKVEMACYEGIPHLMSPVVTEPDKAVAALQWAVREMENRYRLLAKVGAKNLESFNKRYDDGILEKCVNDGKIDASENDPLPYIVVIIDELADLMMTASKDVEALIQRLAQLARAVGIHLIVATQRPSVDIITGPIKANLTSRIAFRTIQQQDSTTILGSPGAEKLLGNGDMLYLKNGAPAIERYHGAFISEEDVENLVAQIKEQGVETRKIQFHKADESGSGAHSSQGGGASDERDELFEEAARMIVASGIASTTALQRRLRLGFARAGRIMDQLCEAGVVGEGRGAKPREILIDATVLEDMFD